MILGARALDTTDRGGLSFKPTAGSHVFEKLGIGLMRTEEIGLGDAYKDIAYLVDVWRASDAPAAWTPCQAAGVSVLD